MTKETKTDIVHIVLMAIVFIIAYSALFTKWLDVNGDNATYIELARNLSNWHGYSTEGPGGARIIASHFPPGYPFFLSLFMLFGIDNLIFFKILNGVLMFAAIALLYLVTSRGTGSRPLAFAAGTVIAVCPSIIKFAVIVMSEMLFMFLISLVLWFLMKQGDDKEHKYGPYFWGAALAAAASYYVRAVGAALLFGVIVWYLTQKDWKKAALSTAVSVAAIIPWSIRNKICGVGRSYLGPVLAKNPWRPELGRIESVKEFMDKMWTNLDDTTIRGFRLILFPGWKGYEEPVTTFGIILGLVLLVMVFYGLYKTGAFRFTLPAIMLANIGFLLIWNGQNDIRYVTPFMPLVIFGFWNCIFQLVSLLWKKASKKPLRVLPYAVCLAVYIAVPTIKDEHDRNKWGLNDNYKNYYKCAEVIEHEGQRLGHKPVVICRKPELIKYYAPNTIPMRSPFVDPDEMLKFIVDNEVEFVILDRLHFSSTVHYLVPFFEKHMNIFDAVHEQGKDKETRTLVAHVDPVLASIFLRQAQEAAAEESE